MPALSWTQLCLAVLLGRAIASPAPGLFDRAPAPTCADTCYTQILRNRQAPSSLAKAGCTAMFQQTVYPCPVTVTRTNFAQATATAATQIITDVEQTTISATDFEPSAYTATITSPSSTATIFSYDPNSPERRDLEGRTPVPACVPRTSSTTVVPSYFASCTNMAAYSSACSCFGVAHTAITKPTPTHYRTVTQTNVNSVTATSITTLYNTNTAVTTIFTPSAAATNVVDSGVSTVTVTTLDPAATPTCTALVDPNGYSWAYVGQAGAETYNDNNPGSSGITPTYLTFSGSLVQCDAVSACLSQAPYYQDYALSFSIYYSESAAAWTCALYYETNSDTSYFNVPDSDAIVDYLYTYNS